MSFQSWIEWYGHVEWAPWSPVLNPLDYWIHGVPKAQASSVKIRDTNNLGQNVTDTYVKIERNA